MVDERGAPLSIVLTGANRHDKVSAIELIVCVLVKRPAHKEQHLCADKAYDATDVREFVASEGYTAHIKTNPRRRAGRCSEKEDPQEKEGVGEKLHPARRWVVERTISWLTKRRGLRTRWAKKSENWLASIQFACAHVLLNLAVFG
jgi:putative transposase